MFLEWAGGWSKIYGWWAFLVKFGREILGARGRWAFLSLKSQNESLKKVKKKSKRQIKVKKSQKVK